jgi:hypothetical protein
MSTRSLAVIANQLEPANHLADGEESEALSEDDAAGNELGLADVSKLLEQGGRLLNCRLEERGGALQRFPGCLVV